MNAVVYRHTQVGRVVNVALGLALAAVVLGAIFTPGRGRLPPAIVAMILGFALMAFHSLTVEVTRDHLRVWFGRGWIRKSFRIGDIVECQSVRNRWIYGWGVRLTPHGWMFNISGLDAVELRFRSGRRFRIGTDEPDQLCSAIRDAMDTSPSAFDTAN